MSNGKRRGHPNVHAIVDGLNMQAAMISPHYTGLASALQEMVDADLSLEEAAWESRKNELISAYGLGDTTGSDKPYAFSNGVAIIPVHGVLVNRFSHSWGYVTGYNFIRNQYEAALKDEDVRAIVLDCNSPGGMVAGCFETASLIYKNRDTKPTLSVVDSSSYSACYAIASSAGKMMVVPSAGVGSIGVVATHVNIGPMLEKMGIEVSFIHAGKHKVDGNPYQALPDDVKKAIQASIDKGYDTFVKTVARNRNLSAGSVRSTEANIYDADEALALGLIDAIETPSKAIGNFLNELSGSNDQQEHYMSQKDTVRTGAEGKEPVVDQSAIVAEARKAERERMAGIMNCDEAKGKEKLANHLATNTEMSLEDAKAILCAAAPEVQESATKKAPAQSSANPFSDYMNSDEHPNVGADVDSGVDTEMSISERILAAQKVATGRSH